MVGRSFDRISDDAQIAVFTSVKASKTSKCFGVIAVGNGLRQDVSIGYVLFCDFNGNTAYIEDDVISYSLLSNSRLPHPIILIGLRHSR